MTSVYCIMDTAREQAKTGFQKMAMKHCDGDSPNIKQEFSLTVAPKKLKKVSDVWPVWSQKVNCHNHNVKPNKSFLSIGSIQSKNSTGKSSKNLICTYCKKEGHTKVP